MGKIFTCHYAFAASWLPHHSFTYYQYSDGREFIFRGSKPNPFFGNLHAEYGDRTSTSEGIKDDFDSLKPTAKNQAQCDTIFEGNGEGLNSQKQIDIRKSERVNREDFDYDKKNCNAFTAFLNKNRGTGLPDRYAASWYKLVGINEDLKHSTTEQFMRDTQNSFRERSEMFQRFVKGFQWKYEDDLQFRAAVQFGVGQAFMQYLDARFEESVIRSGAGPDMRSTRMFGASSQGTSGSSTSGSTPGSGSGSSSTGNQQRSYDGVSWRQGNDGKWHQQSSGSEQQRSNHQQGQQFRDGQQNSPRQDQWSGNQQQSQNGQWQRQQEQQFREQHPQEQQRNEFRQSYQQRQSGGPGASDNFGSQSWGCDFRSDNQNTDTSSGRQQGSSWFGGGFSDSWSWGGFRQSNRRGYNQHQNYGSRASHGSGYYYGPGHSSSRWQRAFENLWTFWRDPSWSNMGSWTAGVRANMRYARSHVSPLVLDLDDDGLKLRGHDEGVYFDIDGDRFLERVGWPDASEAQLARDLSANGVIDNIEELFGDDQISAFFKLGLLDSNRDEIIDEHDLAFDELLLWQDKNYNGYSEPNELRTLKDAGIKSISLIFSVIYSNISNNTVTASASFQYTNGTKATVYDVHYHNDNMDSWYQEHVEPARVSQAELRPYVRDFREDVISGLFKKLAEFTANPGSALQYDWVQSVIRVETSQIKQKFEVDAQRKLFEAALAKNVFYPGKVEAQHSALKARMSGVYKLAKAAALKAVTDQINADIAKARKAIEAVVLPEHEIVKNRFIQLAEIDLNNDKETEIKRLRNKYRHHGAQEAERKVERDFKVKKEVLEKRSKETLRQELKTQWDKYSKRIETELAKRKLAIHAEHKNQTETLMAKFDMEFSKEFVGLSMFQDTDDEVAEQVAGFHKINLQQALIRAKATRSLVKDFANVIASEAEIIYREFIERFVPSTLEALNPRNTTSTNIFKAPDGTFDDMFAFAEPDANSITIDPDALEMPLMRGYGKIPALHVAMSLNPALKGLVQEFVYIEDLTEVYPKALNVLYAWAGVSQIPDNQRATAEGINIEARKVAFIEQLTGQEFKQMGVADFVGQFASEAVQKAFDIFLIRVVASLLVQGPFSTIFTNHSYDFISDKVTLGGPFQKILEAAQKFALERELTADYSFWVQLGYILASSLDELGVTITALRTELSRLAGRPIMVSVDSFGLDGTDGDDVIIGTLGSDHIKALKGNDQVFGDDGSDSIEGNEGDDELHGQSGTDRIYGHDGADRIYGGPDRDFLYGGPGADRIAGQGGDDLVEGGLDGDIMDGGDGEDTLSYGSSDKGVFISLESGMAFGGDADGDTFSNFENIGGSEHNDHLLGNALANHINGECGNDTISGGAGNDHLFGATGDDRLHGEDGNDVLAGYDGPDHMDGGDGNDTASYTHPYSISGVHVDLASGVGRKGFADGDRYVSIENVQGSKYRDTIKGNNEVNILEGNDGDDKIYGEGGDDRLAGGRGDDKVFGGEGDDVIYAGHGSDEIWGGPGNDTISYQFAEVGVNVNLTSGIGKAHLIHEDKIKEVEHVVGSDFDDVLTGDSQNNKLFGLTGDDKMYGLSGDDVFVVGNGSSTVDGGAGRDAISYERLDSAIVVEMRFGRSMIGTAIKDRFGYIENIFGTHFDDKISGDAESNYLSGLDGDDEIDGGKGDDVLVGGMGKNVLKGGDGNDIFISTCGGYNTIYGGTGNNAVHYHLFCSAVNVSLQNKLAISGHITFDIFNDISNIIGSAHADFIVGNREGNTLDGLDGDDFIDGKEGADRISGGNGINRLFGGSGNDKFLAVEGSNTIDGGRGKDLATYRTFMQPTYWQYERDLNAILALRNLLPQHANDSLVAPKQPQFIGVTVDLFDGTAFKPWHNSYDRIANVEKVEGTHYNDTITGDNIDNFLDGVDGNDKIHGGGGKDVIISGRGYSVLNGDDGDDMFAIRSDGEADVFGGPGIDALDLLTHTCLIRIDLALEIISYCGKPDRTIQSVEGIRTGLADDIVRATSADHILIATSEGNDVIYLNGTGRKTIFGGTGADAFVIEPGFHSECQDDVLLADFSTAERDIINASSLPHISNFSSVIFTRLNDTHLVISFGQTQNIAVTTGDMLGASDFIFS